MVSLTEQQGEAVVFRSTLPDISIPDHLPLHDYVLEGLANRRDRACIIDGATGRTLSFGDVHRLSRRVAAGLSSLGVRHGSTVMLLLPNSVEFALAFLASFHLGAVAKMANPLHTPPEIAKQVAASGATVVVTEPPFVAKVRDFADVTVVATGDGTEGCVSFADLTAADDSSLSEVPIDVANEDMTAEFSSANLTGLVDEFYNSALSHGRSDAHFSEDDELFSISDEKYAAELQLQEVIMSSAIAASTVLSSLPMGPTATDSTATSVVCIGEFSSAGSSSSSSSSRSMAATTYVFCKICMDSVPPSEAHRTSSGCEHAFCAVCLAGYIGAKIQDRIADVKCPEDGCASVLDPALCQGMLPREVFERWCAALCESMVLGANRAYCPFKDCSEMMVVEDWDAGDIAESECPSCRRLFCSRCSVPWHAGADCTEYRKLGRGDRGKEDMMVLEMAKGKKWKRCPKCEFFVEKVDGCVHITCRCAFEFCYGCGKQWGGVDHSSCSSV